MASSPSHRLHHLFICVAADGPEAAQLRDAGIVEGSGNVHPGQGTANRRFFFENAYLELLWVHDEVEAGSARTASTQLLQRWQNRDRDASPFGICISPRDQSSAELPYPSWPYQPEYLQGEQRIWFAQDAPLHEAEIFALGWPQPARFPTEPTVHPCGLTSVRRIALGVPEPESVSAGLAFLVDQGIARLYQSRSAELRIEFVASEAIELRLPPLRLVMCRSPGEPPP